MGKTKTRIVAALIALIVMWVPAVAQANTVHATALSKFKGTMTLYENAAYAIGSADVEGLTSSNSRVVQVSVNSNYRDQLDNKSKRVIVLKVVKPGKATVSFTIGTKKYTMKVKVKKRAVVAKRVVLPGPGNPSTITYDKKHASGQAGITYSWKKALRDGAALGGMNGKVKVTAAKGWKVKAIYYYSSSKGRLKKLGNGKKIPRKDSTGAMGTVYVVLQNKKDKGTQTLTYGLS